MSIYGTSYSFCFVDYEIRAFKSKSQGSFLYICDLVACLFSYQSLVGYHRSKSLDITTSVTPSFFYSRFDMDIGSFGGY